MNTIASIWLQNRLGYLSLDIICSSKLTGFLELRSRKIVRFSGRDNARGQISEHIFALNEGYYIDIYA